MQVCGTCCSSFPQYIRTGKFTVCAVFSEACYLEDIHGTMILLHDLKYGTFLFGIGIYGLRDMLEQLSLTEGDTAVLLNGTLIFPDNQLSVYISMQPPEFPICIAHSDEALAKALSKGKSRLKENGKGALQELLFNDGSIQSPFAAVAKRPLASLSAALQKENPDEVEHALLGLLGLGPGLTPSMDDFLMGVMAVRHASSHWNRLVPGAQILEAAVIRLAPQRTNRFSALYLASMAQGQHMSVFSQLLHGRQLLPSAALERLLSIGHNSGGDMLTGVLWALEQLLSPAL